MDDNFDPENVGSIYWRKGSDDAWNSTDLDPKDIVSGTIETVHVGDYEKLMAMYREVKGKYDWLRDGRR